MHIVQFLTAARKRLLVCLDLVSIARRTGVISVAVLLLDSAIFPVDNQLASGISTQFTTDPHGIFFPFGMSACSLRTIAFYIPSSTSRVGNNMMFIFCHCILSLQLC